MEVAITKFKKLEKSTMPELMALKRLGQKGASDFTKHKNKYRKCQYIDKHKAREYWTKSGVKAVGWMNKHVLWNINNTSKY